MVELNQYYTPESISITLASMLDASKANTCIELSAGEGSLIAPLKKINNNLKFTMVDIDPINSESLLNKYPFDTHICADALNKDIGLEDNYFDLAVCNPPFSSIDKCKEHEYILEGGFSELFKKRKKIRLEVLFILRNLQLLKPKGLLAIILPDLIFNSERLLEFRKLLFKKFKLVKVVECQYKNFKKTEAKTYIIFLKKSQSSTKDENIPLISINSGNLSQRKIKLSNITADNVVKDKTYNYKIFRGSTSSKMCRETERAFHHNYSNLKDFSVVSYKDYKDNLPQFKYAQKGDILIHRVGRLVGKTVILNNQSVIISDCIITIRFLNEKDRIKFLKNWQKDKEQWLSRNIKGTCAKNISIQSLKLYLKSLDIN